MTSLGATKNTPALSSLNQVMESFGRSSSDFGNSQAIIGTIYYHALFLAGRLVGLSGR
jgi:hypothetical protein